MTDAAPILLILPHLDVSGGLGVHCRMLLAALQSVPSPRRFVVVSPTEPAKLFPSTGAEPFDISSVDANRFDFCRVATPPGFSLAQPWDVWLKDVIHDVKPALVYSSYYTGLQNPGAPQIIAFHDAGFLDNPAGFGATAMVRKATLDSIRDSISLIQCISHDARDRICDKLPWDAARTAVVWHALPDSPALLNQARDADAAVVTVAGQSLSQWSPYYFLPVGAATGFNRVRKNVPNAVRAFDSLKDANLIIAGTAELDEKMLRELLPPECHGRRDGDLWRSADNRIVIVPTLDRLTFLTAMRLAVAVVYPSRYEGFGLPTLEAMALGVPLIAANATSLPEIVADAGLLVEPDDVAGLTQALQQVRQDTTLRQILIERGLKRIEMFSLTRMGAEMNALFETR